MDDRADSGADCRLDPQDRYERVRAGIGALVALKDDDAHAVMDPRFWAKNGTGELALEGLGEVARHYAEEHGASEAGGVFCVHCDDPIDDPEEAREEAHAGCAQADAQGDAGEEDGR